MIILRPKNVIFERFWQLSKFHFPACSTLHTTHFLYSVFRIVCCYHNMTIKIPHEIWSMIVPIKQRVIRPM